MRDYDKEPIVIKDRWVEIDFWYYIHGLIASAIIIILIFYVFAILPIKKDLNPTYMIVLYGTIYGGLLYDIYKRTKRNATIFIYNDKITRDINGKTLMIEWHDIKEIKKTFIDFYSKRQKAYSVFDVLLCFLILPLYIILIHPTLIATKYLYKVAKSFSNKKIFDSIVFIANNDEMISVFMANEAELIEVGKYLESKNIDIEQLPIFYTTQYLSYKGI